jgi:hypothetical protein
VRREQQSEAAQRAKAVWRANKRFMQISIFIFGNCLRPEFDRTNFDLNDCLAVNRSATEFFHSVLKISGASRFVNPQDISGNSRSLTVAAGLILGASGPLRWSKNAKTESPSRVHPLSSRGSHSRLYANRAEGEGEMRID